MQIRRLDAAAAWSVDEPVGDGEGRLRDLRSRPQADHPDRQRPARPAAESGQRRAAGDRPRFRPRGGRRRAAGREPERRPRHRPLHRAAAQQQADQTMNEAATFRARPPRRSATDRRARSPLDRQILRPARGAARRLARRPPRRGGRPARPQRRRQDDLLLFGHGAGEARQRPHLPRRRGHHRPADVPPRDPRPRLSAAGNLDLPRPDRRAEHHGRARGRRARQAGARATGSSSCSASSA